MEVVSVIGPLGSGKTTTVNELIKHVPIGDSYAVVVNDVGTENIDAQRIAQHEGNRRDSIVALTAGCIGCSDVTQFQEALHDVASKEIDLLFIEPTGIAPGHEIVDVVRGSGYDLSVLTLVNSRSAERDMRYQVLKSQLAVADMVGLTHFSDSESQVDVLERVVDRLPPLPSSLELRLLDSQRIDGKFLAELRGLTTEYSLGAIALSDGAIEITKHLEAPAHHHAHGVTAQSLQPLGDIDISRLQAVLQQLAAHEGQPLLRAKGVVGDVQFDVTGGDENGWHQRLVPSGTTATQKINVIFAGSSLPPTASMLSEFVVDDVQVSVSHDKKEVVKSIVDLPVNQRVEEVNRYINVYPSPISGSHGELITDCEADNAYEICFWPGEGKDLDMPENIKYAAMHAYIDFRLKGWEELQQHADTIQGLPKKRAHWLRRYGATLGYNGYYLDHYISSEQQEKIREIRPEQLLSEGFMTLQSLTFDEGRAEEKPEFIAAVLKRAVELGHISADVSVEVASHGVSLSVDNEEWHARWARFLDTVS